MIETNIIHNMDCLEGMKLIPDHFVDAIICDLPYGTTRNTWDCIIPFDALWKEYKRIIKEKGAIILFGQGMFTARLMMSNSAWWRYNLVWNKTQPSGFLNARRMPLRTHEDICVFYKHRPTYNPIMTTGVRKTSSAESKRKCVKTTNYGFHKLMSYDSDMRFPTSVIRVAKDIQHSAIHPTQKPVALIEWLVRTYTNPRGIVMDNCSGSGSLAIACIKTGRNYICFEKDPDYYRLSIERIERYNVSSESEK